MKFRIALALLAISLGTPLAADEPVANPFRIAIEVSVADEDLQGRVAQYLSEELSALGDVEVTADNPDYKLYAVVMQVRTSANTRMAYVLGVSVVTFFPDHYFDSILRTDLANASEVRARLGEVTVYKNQFLSLAGPTEANLNDVVANAVQKFDTHILRFDRQSRGNESDPTS